MIKLGDNNVTLKLGDNDVSKVYMGDTQIYPSTPATNLVMQRISSTEYLVTGDAGTADLTFTRESDNFVDAKGVQSLPYTFTHTAGEKWSVNGVNAWGVNFNGSNTQAVGNYSDAYQITRLEFDFKFTYQGDVLLFWQGFSNPNYRNQVWIRNDGIAGLQIDSSTTSYYSSFTSWNANFNKYTLDGTNHILNGESKPSGAFSIPSSGHLIRLGSRPSGSSTFNGVISRFKINNELFEINEGSGNTITGSLGNYFTLSNHTWVIV